MIGKLIVEKSVAYFLSEFFLNSLKRLKDLRTTLKNFIHINMYGYSYLYESANVSFIH